MAEYLTALNSKFHWILDNFNFQNVNATINSTDMLKSLISSIDIYRPLGGATVHFLIKSDFAKGTKNVWLSALQQFLCQSQVFCHEQGHKQRNWSKLTNTISKSKTLYYKRFKQSDKNIIIITWNHQSRFHHHDWRPSSPRASNLNNFGVPEISSYDQNFDGEPLTLV